MVGTMKALVVKAFGPAEDAFELKDLPKPTPLPRDLLVKLKAVAMNPVDTKVRKGMVVGEAPKDTLILGYDGAGIVEAVGSEAKLFKVGDEVYFAGSRVRNGTNAEYIVVDERIVGKKPKTIEGKPCSWEQAAAIPLCAITAWEGLVEQFGLAPNSDYSSKTILVVAGAGGVGSIVIPLAKKVFNLKVIATASRPETIEYSKKMGADATIDHTKDLLEQLKALGYPTGVDYIYNCAESSQNLEQLIPVVTHFGKIVCITGINKPINIGSLFLKRATLTFEFMFARPITGIEIEKQHQLLTEITELTEKGIIPDRMTQKLPLTVESLAKSHKQLESGTTIGKVSMTVDW